jgi:hypothetical protein
MVTNAEVLKKIVERACSQERKEKYAQKQFDRADIVRDVRLPD